jgi:drug/metabolite transporter (DMT)-like permease
MLPLSLLMIVVQTNPFWTALLAYFMAREIIQRFELIGMVLSFIGVIAISLYNPKQTEISDNSNQRVSGILFAFFVAWLYAGGFVLSRKLKETPSVIVLFANGIVGMPTAAIWLLIESQIRGTPIRIFSAETYGTLAMICVIDYF